MTTKGPPAPRYTRQVQVRLTDEQFDALKALSQAEGIRISVAVRLLLGWALLPDENRQLELALDDDAVTPAELLHRLVQVEAERAA
jgi:hypothetical protein